jgi:hypothetical protein
MSLQELPRPHHVRLPDKQQRKRKLPEPLDVTALGRLHDDQVLTRQEWRQLNRLSDRESRRIWNDPDRRPEQVQLTARRRGVTVGANRRWQQAQSR